MYRYFILSSFQVFFGSQKNKLLCLLCGQAGLLSSFLWLVPWGEVYIMKTHHFGKLGRIFLAECPYQLRLLFQNAQQ